MNGYPINIIEYNYAYSFTWLSRKINLVQPHDIVASKHNKRPIMTEFTSISTYLTRSPSGALTLPDVLDEKSSLL